MVNERTIRVVAADPTLKHYGIATFDYDFIINKVSNVKLEIVENPDLHLQSVINSPFKRVDQGYETLKAGNKIFNRLKHHLKDADLLVTELFVGARCYAALYSLLGGFIMAAFTDVPVILVLPHDAKKVISGNLANDTNAGKREIIKWAKKEFPEANWYSTLKYNEHVADAIAIGVAGVNSEKFESVLKDILRRNGQ